MGGSYRSFYATTPTVIKILKLPLRERALYAPSCGFASLDELLLLVNTLPLTEWDENKHDPHSSGHVEGYVERVWQGVVVVSSSLKVWY